MSINMGRVRATALSLLCTAGALAGCGSDKANTPARADGKYVLSSVVIDGDGNRTTYVQAIPSLDAGPFDNAKAVEVPGNGVVLASRDAFFVGLAEEPTWVRYSLRNGQIADTGRLSLLDRGAKAIDYGNVIVDDETAVSVFGETAEAVVWNPSSMEILGTIDLGMLVREGYSLEVWTTVAHDGLVYIPARWSDWEGGRIFSGVSLTIVDPYTRKVIGTAQDDRCASGGRPVFDADGYAYVMGDGRNYSSQMFANAQGEAPPSNCLLRIAPGETKFEKDYFFTIPSLTQGLESITELESPSGDQGVAFAKMFYREKLPKGMEPVDFAFWDVPAHKLWRIELANPPRAREVEGMPFGAIGFSGSALDGRLYAGESADGGRSVIYEIDPEKGSATRRFEMTGYFNGLYKLQTSAPQ